MTLLSRQPVCGACMHEEHLVDTCECGCGPHLPTGVYLAVITDEGDLQ